MKLTFKLTTGILAMAVVVGGSAARVAAQNADAIDNARSTAKSLQQNPASPAAKAASPAAKPAPGAPAPAVKPAAIPGSKAAVKPASSAKPAAETSTHNHLQKVNVVPGANGLQIEISSSQAVTPSVTKLDSPARLLVELPDTTIASAQNKIPVGSGGVKGVRIGMDGKTPPTTSVVVDLEKPLAYELTPGPAGKVILTLHSEGAATVAKSGPAAKTSAPVAKASAPAAKPAAPSAAAPAKVTVAKTSSAKPTLIPANVAVAKAPATKPGATAAKPETKQPAKTIVAAKIAAPPTPAPTLAKAAAATPAKPKPEEKKWAMNGKRDPFFSPVVQSSSGSGCSTGKKCLEVGSINLRGVVKSDSGFIAVVTNNLNKAYFLRENDPVFNGYVVKITGDSVVFQETLQDKLGKPFTREVVKKIFTPAV